MKTRYLCIAGVMLAAISTGVQAGVIISPGALGTGTITNAENFEAVALGGHGLSLSTASGFEFQMTSNYFVVSPFQGLPTASLGQEGAGPFGGANSMTSIRLTSGADIDAIEFDVGNPWDFINVLQAVWIRAYENGVYTGFEYFNQSVSFGTFTVTSSGTNFDEVRVQSLYAGSTLNPLHAQGENQYGSATLDNIKVYSAQTSAVPEPASLAMWGLGALGMAIARRKRNRQALTL